MSNLNRETLAEVASGTLEEAAFIFTEPGEPTPDWDTETAIVKISFEGTERGTLWLVSSARFAVELAANLLGLEPDDPDAIERGTGALGEMLNMICGALMEAAFGTGVICNLGIPTPTPLSQEELNAKLESAEHAISMMTDEDHRLDMILDIH